MANAQRGEVAAIFRGQPVALALTFNGMCDLEERFGCGIEEAMARFDDAGGTRPVRMTDIRALVHVLLRHSLPQASEAEAGAFIEELGIDAVGELLTEVIARSRIASPAADGGSAARPPERAGA